VEGDSFIAKLIFGTIFIFLIFFISIPDIPIKSKPPVRSVLRAIKKSINEYYIEKGIYVKKLKELTETNHPYFSEIPENPITERTDWEVCDHSNKNIWYRTVTDVYEPSLPLWNPGPESGIYDVRPCSKSK